MPTEAEIKQGGWLKADAKVKADLRAAVPISGRFSRNALLAGQGDGDAARIAFNELVNEMSTAGEIEWLGAGQYKVLPSE